MIKHILLVGIGGAVGSILRYLTALFVSKYYANIFPLATFTANVVGCLLIGLFIGFLNRYYQADADLRLLLATGFCGGYTTFSAFSAESLHLLQQGNYLIALTYVGVSVVFSLLAVGVGLALFEV
ncbi:fluoride efflux transporter CrcB [Rufibacter sediminis]|uniref:Fluoride-specific ion channel FluC n=1 Tax=Rufibacter sediminis TaxID=2762756 RepID=A0ABR6VMC8_9BACT|nr:MULTISPECIES: fluoride efflux transporter CrcB [Rufibacter]MBC3538364.1 fluoride efflux transporter CrcB [Rufibacter sediminis]